jgi:hypothetical protein
MASTVNMQTWIGRLAGVMLPAGAVAKVPGACGTGLVPVMPQG